MLADEAHGTHLYSAEIFLCPEWRQVLTVAAVSMHKSGGSLTLEFAAAFE